ncbi:hypothetical protein H4R34_006437, partial [Dimargaris verticillata]
LGSTEPNTASGRKVLNILDDGIKSLEQNECPSEKFWFNFLKESVEHLKVDTLGAQWFAVAISWRHYLQAQGDHPISLPNPPAAQTIRPIVHSLEEALVEKEADVSGKILSAAPDTNALLEA